MGDKTGRILAVPMQLGAGLHGGAMTTCRMCSPTPWTESTSLKASRGWPMPGVLRGYRREMLLEGECIAVSMGWGKNHSRFGKFGLARTVGSSFRLLQMVRSVPRKKAFELARAVLDGIFRIHQAVLVPDIVRSCGGGFPETRGCH